VGLLEQHFGRLVDYDFTAALEDELDRIAEGAQQRTKWLSGFYWGGDVGPDDSIGRAGGLKKLVGSGVETIDAREVNSIPMFTDDQDRIIYVRVGRYGPYLERPLESGEAQRANLPEDVPPDELTVEHCEKLFATPMEGRSLGTDPETGHEVVAKEGRFGPYVTEVLPEGDKSKPRTGSLLKSMSLDTVTLDDALKILSLPRTVGTDPETGNEITAQNGRYGPYLKKGTDSRSLETEEQLFTVTLDEALELYKQPKQRGRRAPAPPLRELGEDPESGKPLVIKDGRFGPYVTDGETNASLRKGDDVESVSMDRAVELIGERRAKAPAKKKSSAKSSGTKSSSSKSGSSAKSSSSKSSSTSKSGTSKTSAGKASASKSGSKTTSSSKSGTTKSSSSKSPTSRSGSTRSSSSSSGSKSTSRKSRTAATSSSSTSDSADS